MKVMSLLEKRPFYFMMRYLKFKHKMKAVMTTYKEVCIRTCTRRQNNQRSPSSLCLLSAHLSCILCHSITMTAFSQECQCHTSTNVLCILMINYTYSVLCFECFWFPKPHFFPWGLNPFPTNIFAFIVHWVIQSPSIAGYILPSSFFSAYDAQ